MRRVYSYIQSVTQRRNRPHSAHRREEPYKKSHSLWSLIINGLTVIVASLAAIFAFWAYQETRTQTAQAILSSNAAVKSAAYGDSVFQATKDFNKKTLRLTRQKDSLDSIDSRLRFINESASLGAQIKSIQQEGANFKLLNEPYIQMISFLDTFAVGKPISVKIQLQNLGSYPVKVLLYRETVATRVTNPGLSNITEQNTGKTLLNTYIVKGLDPVYITTVLGDDPQLNILNQNRYNQVMNGVWSVWYGGVLEYENLITKEPKRYKFMFQLKPNRLGFSIINENE